MPEISDPDQSELDVRYFLLAVGNRGTQNEQSVSGQPLKKVVFIDDLEIPSKKGQNIEQLYFSLSKLMQYTSFETLKQTFIAYRTNQITAFTLLQEFERLLGIAKAFKYYWAFLNNSKTSGGMEMEKELKKSLKKMSYRNQACLLATSASYREVFHHVSSILYDYLQHNQEKLIPTTEVRLNSIISSLCNHSLSHLIQARPLPHLISSPSLSLLKKLYFDTEEEIQKALNKSDCDDVLILMIYCLVTLIKCGDAFSVSSPGLRGLEWIRDKYREFDLSWLPLEKRDRVPKPGSETIYGTHAEEFPELVPTKGKTGEVNIQEMMAAEAARKKLLEAESQSRKKQTRVFSGGVAMPVNFQQPFGLPSFGSNFKIPLLDPSKPLPISVKVNTLPVNPFQYQVPNNSTKSDVLQPETLEETERLQGQEPIDNGITIFKKQRKKK